MSNRELGRAYASVLIPADDRWNPLEHVTATEYVPSVWIGAHVGLRLIEAFKTLAMVPVNRGPRSKSGYWPNYRVEWVDLLAQQEADAQVKEDIARSINRVRITPSAQAVTRMEAALSWPARYLHQRPLVMRVVQTVARGSERSVTRATGSPGSCTNRRRRSGASTALGSMPLLLAYTVTAWWCFDGAPVVSMLVAV